MPLRRDLSSDTRQTRGKRSFGDLLQPVLAVERALDVGAESLPGDEEDHADAGSTAASSHRTGPDSRLPSFSHVFTSSARRSTCCRTGRGTAKAKCVDLAIENLLSACSSCRFVKQEQWERWRAKRKFVSGSKHRGRFCWYPGGMTPEKI